MIRTLALALPLCLPEPAAAQVRAFTGARLVPIDGPEIERGVLVVDGARIAAVGAEGDVAIPDGAETVDASGKVISPGLICTHSHLGGIGAADGSHPLQPGVRVQDSLNPFSAGYRRAVAGGLTTINVMPGSGHLSSGQTIYLKLRLGGDGPRVIDDLFVFDRSEGSRWGDEPMGGLKMANGTNSQRSEPFPGTRGKSAQLVRSKFIAAMEYRDKVAAADGDPAKLPARDLDLEAPVDVMSGRRIVHHHTHRADDIMTVLRLSKEFGFRVVLHHISEGWKVADEIAAAGAPCSVILVDSPGGKLEAKHVRFETGGILERAGVDVAFHTDDWITDSRWFNRSAALAVRAGMSRAAALRALTLSGAEMLDLGDRIGSLTPGKDADFAIWSGDPLSLYSRVEETWVEGERVFDYADPEDRLIAEGGYGALEDEEPYFCCFDHLLAEGR